MVTHSPETQDTMQTEDSSNSSETSTGPGETYEVYAAPTAKSQEIKAQPDEDESDEMPAPFHEVFAYQSEQLVEALRQVGVNETDTSDKEKAVRKAHEAYDTSHEKMGRSKGDARDIVDQMISGLQGFRAQF